MERKDKSENFIAKFPMHKMRDKSDAELDAEDMVEPSVQRPQRWGERADSFENDEFDIEDDMEEEKEAKMPMDEAKRMKGNVDEISKTIMQMLDAIDADENSKIDTIMIEIGIK